MPQFCGTLLNCGNDFIVAEFFGLALAGCILAGSILAGSVLAVHIVLTKKFSSTISKSPTRHPEPSASVIATRSPRVARRRGICSAAQSDPGVEHGFMPAVQPGKSSGFSR